MSNWLSKRLTPPKAKEARWTELSEVLERTWETYFDPDQSRLESLRSCYIMADSDLIAKIREMGDYFSFEWPERKDRPISLAWRRLELEYKDMELILMSVFRRHYSNLPVTWFPIFAPIDQAAHPYGTVFETAQGPWPVRKNEPPEDMFLTSRGRLGTDYGRLLQLGILKQDFLDKALPLLKRTKPLHIVYDGPLWYIWFDLPFDVFLSPDLLYWERENYSYELQFTVRGARFDYTPADATWLDCQTMRCDWQRTDNLVLPFGGLGNSWRLDWYLPEGFPTSWLPLDIIIAGNERKKHPFTLVANVHKNTFPMVAKKIESKLSKQKHVWQGWTFQAVSDALSEIINSFALPFKKYRSALPLYPKFDECPADFAPLDMPIGVQYV